MLFLTKFSSDDKEDSESFDINNNAVEASENSTQKEPSVVEKKSSKRGSRENDQSRKPDYYAINGPGRNLTHSGGEIGEDIVDSDDDEKVIPLIRPLNTRGS